MSDYTTGYRLQELEKAVAKLKINVADHDRQIQGLITPPVAKSDEDEGMPRWESDRIGLLKRANKELREEIEWACEALLRKDDQLHQSEVRCEELQRQVTDLEVRRRIWETSYTKACEELNLLRGGGQRLARTIINRLPTVIKAAEKIVRDDASGEI